MKAKPNRPKVDESLCFVCQENKPTRQATREDEIFLLCDECADVVKAENDYRNRMKESFRRNDRQRIFEYTLGWNLRPTKIDIQEIK